MEIKTYVEGRHNFTKPLRHRNAVVTVSCYNDSVTIRHDDKANPEFWLHTTLTREQLLEMLKQMDEAKE